MTDIEKAAQQEPVGQLMEEAYGRGQVLWFNKPDDLSMLYTSPQPAQQKSVGEVYRHGRDSHGREWHGIHWYDANVDVPHGTKLYISPQRKPWVGLTPRERIMCRSYDPEEAVAKTEAKLKEKNT